VRGPDGKITRIDSEVETVAETEERPKKTVTSTYKRPDLHVNSGAIRLSWERPAAQLAAKQISGFKLYCGYSERTYIGVQDVGNRTDYQLRNLEGGRRYHFSVTAYNADGSQSDYSREIVVAVSL